MIYLQTKNLCKNDFDGVKNYYGSHFSQTIQKLPKTSCVLTIAVYLVRLTICLFSGMVRIKFFDCTCFDFDGYKYFVEYVKCSSPIKEIEKFQTIIGSLLFHGPFKRLPLSVRSISLAIRTVQCIVVSIVWMDRNTFHFELSLAHEKFLGWTEL